MSACCFFGDCILIRTIVSALYEPKAQIKAVECSHCSLDDRLVNILMGSLERQFASLECINISDNPGRLNIEKFQISMGRFTRLRKINISRTSWTSGEQSLFPTAIMLTWRLEKLSLNGIPVRTASKPCLDSTDYKTDK